MEPQTEGAVQETKTESTEAAVVESAVVSPPTPQPETAPVVEEPGLGTAAAFAKAALLAQSKANGIAITTKVEEVPLTKVAPVDETAQMAKDALLAKEAADAAKPSKKALKVVEPDVPMTTEQAKTLLAKYEGKKGRRPAAFYEAQALLGIASTKKPAKVAKAPKAPKAAKAKVAKAKPSEAMTHAEAKALLAKYEGKKGRRPNAFYEALKVLGVTPAKAKAAAAAEKAAAKEKKVAKEKKEPTTGQSGPALKDLTVEDLNEKERNILLNLGTEGHRHEKSIAAMAAECYPNKAKAKGNSWIRNGLRRLMRAKLLEKDARGIFKQSLEGREVAKKLVEKK